MFDAILSFFLCTSYVSFLGLAVYFLFPFIMAHVIPLILCIMIMGALSR